MSAARFAANALRLRHTELAGPDTAAWRVRLLGGFEIDDGRHRVTRLRSRAAMALLARVAMAPSRDHAREELAALLWPGADAATGRSRLRQTLSLLRAVLEPAGAPAVLHADRRVLRAVPGALWCDAAAFEQALQTRPDEALALYRGELLPGFFDEWLVDERQRLHALAERLREREGTLLRPVAPTAPAASAASAAPAAPTAHRYSAQRLPHYATRLIGADVQGARLLAQITEHRVVTVLGPGGCGKTRLAVEVAALACQAPRGAAAARFDSAVFTPLVAACTRSEVFDRLQMALRIEAAGPPLQQLQIALDGRTAVVVLDNAEQLGDDAVAAIAEANHDDIGLVWPREISPADVHVVIAGKADGPQIPAGEQLAADLEAAGLRVLLDDRYGPSPGVKFKDAELLGIPTIAIVGRGVADEENSTIEVKDRRSGDRQDIPLADVVTHLVATCRP